MNKALLRKTVAALTLATVSTLCHAAPIADGLAFRNANGNGAWIDGDGLKAYTGTDPVNGGQVGDNMALFYVQEALADGLQSWYLFFDPQSQRRVRGTLDFGTTIVSVFTTKDELTGSQDLYGVDIDGDGAFDDYGTHDQMGLEAGDGATSAENSSRLYIDWTTADPGDHIRVLVQAPPPTQAQDVPEPASAALALLALAAAGLARRRKTR